MRQCLRIGTLAILAATVLAFGSVSGADEIKTNLHLAQVQGENAMIEKAIKFLIEQNVLKLKDGCSYILDRTAVDHLRYSGQLNEPEICMMTGTSDTGGGCAGCVR